MRSDANVPQPPLHISADLTGDQLTSKSGTATIISCLKQACRVIELDVSTEALALLCLCLASLSSGSRMNPVQFNYKLAFHYLFI